ncbi:hypothetical protein Tco_0156442 [Tanacetum coccineum]
MTNFPDHITAHDLWQAYNDYRFVVDAFIPYKKSKVGKMNNVMSDQVLPSLILDDSCISDRDFSLSLKGKVKDITTIPNLYVILKNEGFQNFEPFGDEEDAKDDGPQSGDNVTTDNDVERRKDSGDDLKYPPGFIPSMINVEELNKMIKGDTSSDVNEHVNSTSKKLEESIPKGKLSSNNCVCSKRVHTGGSILQLMNELVKRTKMESDDVPSSLARRSPLRAQMGSSP